MCGRDLDVDALVRGVEDAVERVVDRVREDVGPGDHHHPEKHRERRQAGAQLARPEPAKRQRGHPVGLQQLVHVLDVRRGRVVHDPAVAQHDHAVADRRGVGVVGDHHDRLVELVDGLAKEVEHLGAGAGVEVAGRLVGEDDRRARDERARDRDALLLAARELGGPMRAAVVEADGVDQVIDPLVVDVAAGDRERQDDVLLRRQDGQQVEGLEDEADLLAAKLGQMVVVERRDLGAVDVDRARRRACRGRRGSA